MDSFLQEKSGKIPVLLRYHFDAHGYARKTGFDFPGERIYPKFLPVDQYVEKPIEPQVLLEKIEFLLAK